jgi:hypothetical protein
MYPAVPAAVPVRVSAFVRLSVEEVLSTVVLAASALSRATSLPANFANPKSVPAGKSPKVRVAIVAGHTLLKFFFGEMLNQLREDGASRVHPSLFHPIDRRKEVKSSLFLFKSFFFHYALSGLSSMS